MSTTVTLTHGKTDSSLFLTLNRSPKALLNHKVDQLLDGLKALHVANSAKIDAWREQFEKLESDKGEDVTECLCQLIFQFIDPGFQTGLSVGNKDKLRQLSDEAVHLLNGTTDSADKQISAAREYFLKQRALAVVEGMKKTGLNHVNDDWWNLFERVNMKEEAGRKDALDLLCYFRCHYTYLPLGELLEYDDQMSALMAVAIPDRASVENYFAEYNTHVDRLNLARKKHAKLAELAREKDREITEWANGALRSLQQTLVDCRQHKSDTLKRSRVDVQALAGRVNAMSEKVSVAVKAVDFDGLLAVAKSKEGLESQCRAMIESCGKLLGKS